MKVYQLKFEQQFPKPIDEIWDFFASPLNLSLITPNNMAFDVTTAIDPGIEMYQGMIICYKVSPLFGIKLNWMTEITTVENQKYFIDEQRFGPFQFWHHQHHFKAITGGTAMTDLLTYALPYGFLGTIAHQLMVKNKIKEIFRFRTNKTSEIFGSL